MAMSIDLTTLPGYVTLREGKTYKISCKAMATGFKDSNMSGIVKYTVPKTSKIIERGSYKWIDTPTISIDERVDFTFTSNNEPYTMVRTRVLVEGNYNCINYTDNENLIVGYYDGHGWGIHSLNNGIWSSMVVEPAYQIITFEEDIEVPANFYDWAIMGGNLIKYEPETWLLNETIDETELNSTIYFISNDIRMKQIVRTYVSEDENSLKYIENQNTTAPNEYEVYSQHQWTNDTYRTIVFDNPVTDETLLAWLEANGTRQ